jgi:hypothetical protein
MKFELKPNNRNASDQDLLDDIIKVVKEFNKETITRDEYDEKGRFDSATIRKRFKGWLNALEKAGLPKTINYNDSNEDLFKNIEEVWLKLGRQPYAGEMKPPFSKYWRATYERRFGSWRKGLEAFIEYINAEDDNNDEPEIEETIQEKKKEFKHKTKRFPSERLKVQVLMRDGNKCALCGITVTGENIHFDHIIPWAKGGETVLENLQILCEPHNIAKGTLEYPDK